MDGDDERWRRTTAQKTMTSDQRQRPTTVQKRRRTTATDDGDTANGFSSGMRQRRGPRPSSTRQSERVVYRSESCTKTPGLPAGQPEQISCAAAPTTASSGGWGWGLFPGSELSAGAAKRIMVPTLIGTITWGDRLWLGQLKLQRGGAHKPQEESNPNRTDGRPGQLLVFRSWSWFRPRTNARSLSL